MIAIVQCCGNNIASIQFALERLGQKPILTNDARIIKAAQSCHFAWCEYGSAGHGTIEKFSTT